VCPWLLVRTVPTPGTLSVARVGALRVREDPLAETEAEAAPPQAASTVPPIRRAIANTVPFPARERLEMWPKLIGRISSMLRFPM